MENHLTLAAEVIGYIGKLPVTNTLVVTWLVSAFLIVMSMLATRRVSLVPSGLQNLTELVIEPIYNLTSDLAHSKAKAVFPIIMTFFLFILTANWFGLLPGFGTIGFFADEHGKRAFVPLLRSINSDLNTTLALALTSVGFTHILALKYLGLGAYLKKWFSPNPVFLFVGILELVSEGTKTLSLSLRLFGNIFAGEVVLTTVAGLLHSGLSAFVIPLPFYFLEIIVGVVQAAVFMMLTLVFMVLLIQKHDSH